MNSQGTTATQTAVNTNNKGQLNTANTATTGKWLHMTPALQSLLLLTQGCPVATSCVFQQAVNALSFAEGNYLSESAVYSTTCAEYRAEV